MIIVTYIYIYIYIHIYIYIERERERDLLLQPEKCVGRRADDPGAATEVGASRAAGCRY